MIELVCHSLLGGSLSGDDSGVDSLSLSRAFKTGAYNFLLVEIND